MIQKDRCRKYKLYSFFLYFSTFLSKLDCLHTRIFSKNNTETNECREKVPISPIYFSYFIFYNDNEAT